MENTSTCLFDYLYFDEWCKWVTGMQFVLKSSVWFPWMAERGVLLDLWVQIIPCVLMIRKKFPRRAWGLSYIVHLIEKSIKFKCDGVCSGLVNLSCTPQLVYTHQGLCKKRHKFETIKGLKWARLNGVRGKVWLLRCMENMALPLCMRLWKKRKDTLSIINMVHRDVCYNI